MRALRAVEPSGPYLIGGFSSGGLVAHEMAQQLRSAGEPVALLALLDPTWPSAAPLGERLRQLAGVGTPDSPRNSSAMSRRTLQRVYKSVRTRGRLATAGIVARPYASQRQVFIGLCDRMGRRYQPTPYDGPSLLVRTTDSTKR